MAFSNLPSKTFCNLLYPSVDSLMLKMNLNPNLVSFYFQFGEGNLNPNLL